MSDDHLLDQWGQLMDPTAPMPTVQTGLGRRGFLGALAGGAAALAMGGGQRPSIPAPAAAPTAAAAAPKVPMVRVRLPQVVSVADYLPDPEDMEDADDFDEESAHEEAFDAAANDHENIGDLVRNELRDYGLNPEDLEKIEHGPGGSEFVEFDSDNLSHAGAHYHHELVMPKDVYERFREKYAHYNNMTDEDPIEVDNDLGAEDFDPSAPEPEPDMRGWYIDGQPGMSWMVSDDGIRARHPDRLGVALDHLVNSHGRVAKQADAAMSTPQLGGEDAGTFARAAIQEALNVDPNHRLYGRHNRALASQMQQLLPRLTWYDGQVHHPMGEQDPGQQVSNWLKHAASGAAQAMQVFHKIPDHVDKMERTGNALGEAFKAFMDDSISRHAVQQTLRGGEATRAADRQSRSIDQALLTQATPIPDDLVVYRPIHKEHAGLSDEDSAVGQHIADRSYLTATADPERASELSKQTGAVMAVHLPKGTPVLHHNGDVLLPRGTRLRVTGHDQASDGTHLLTAEHEGK